MPEEVADCTFYPEGKKEKKGPDEHDGTFRLPPEKEVPAEKPEETPKKK